MSLLQLCVSSSFFKYDAEIYQQKQGTPMGSPISVCLAEITMQFIEKSILQNPPCEVNIWKRYVDDVIAIIPNASIDDFFRHINS